jgi:hypothetical protein
MAEIDTVDATHTAPELISKTVVYCGGKLHLLLSLMF